MRTSRIDSAGRTPRTRTTTLDLFGHDMCKLTVYGLPLNPLSALDQLAGASFCVSYGTRDKLNRQLDDAIRLVGEEQILLVDNGAFGMHKRGVDARDEAYLEDYERWAQAILDRCPQAIAVIPDVIEGAEAENWDLIMTTLLDYERAMPISHMHESIDTLIHLCESPFNYVGFGSSGEFWKVGTGKWARRIDEAFAAIDRWERESEGAYIRPRIHMMRAQSKAHLFPFDSSDSCNVAINHNRYRGEGGDWLRRRALFVDERIQGSAGPEAEHQVKRPLLEHLETARWRASFWEGVRSGRDF